jgi:hypothetical protein
MNLILSLLFGIGQVIAGVLLVRYGAREGRWRRARVFLMLLFGVWFATSGLAELVVSGMETARQLIGAPSAASFALWRERADRTLLYITIAVLVAAVAHPLLTRLEAAWRDTQH